jgi:hypothetical protein
MNAGSVVLLGGTRRLHRADAISISTEVNFAGCAPAVPGSNGANPECIVACLLDNYPASVQEKFLQQYVDAGYTHLQRSLGHEQRQDHSRERQRLDISRTPLGALQRIGVMVGRGAAILRNRPRRIRLPALSLDPASVLRGRRGLCARLSRRRRLRDARWPVRSPLR